MRHEKIINKADGKRVKISVMVSIGNGDKTPFRTSVELAEKGKRTWTNVTKDDRAFRVLSSENKTKVDLNNQLSFVTESELHDAKLEAWRKIKPHL
jgi:hypothetical protein